MQQEEQLETVKTNTLVLGKVFYSGEQVTIMALLQMD